MSLFTSAEISRVAFPIADAFATPAYIQTLIDVQSGIINKANEEALAYGSVGDSENESEKYKSYLSISFSKRYSQKSQILLIVHFRKTAKPN